MRLHPLHNPCGDRPNSRARARTARAGGAFVLGAVALLAGTAKAGQQPASASAEKPHIASSADSTPDAGSRKRQLSDDSSRLLALAIALKAEVDKTSKDTLSLNVIRKADEIEKLAHNVKAKTKLTAGGE